MNHTNNKVFAAFKHTEAKTTYWIKEGWYYDTENPGLFPYDTKEDKKRVEDVGQDIIKHWGLVGVELVLMKIISSEKIVANMKHIAEPKPVIQEEEKVVKKRGRKPKEHNA